MTKRPLQGTDNILDLQDNGYKSTVSAVSEIIDNSLQANAKNIDVIIIKDTTVDSNEIFEMLIVDDGDGMNKDVFDKALQMSSGTRSGAKSGLGKYGQGLPNSSISQTRRVEVYTYQLGKCLYNYIDLNEIYKSGEAFLPDIEEVDAADIPIISAGKYVPPERGTIVRWVTPNRIRPKTAKTLTDHIQKVAGRIFRYYLRGYEENGVKYKADINILNFDYNGSTFEKNDFNSRKKILPFDPMFLMKNTQMNSLFPESEHPTSQLWKEPLKKRFEVLHNGNVEETEVEIRLSYVKKAERLRYGRNAGDTQFGKTYLKRNSFGTMGYDNISIVRAGREIDSGNFGFIHDVSDQRNRWWSAEIIVHPLVDSIIGVDNKKQQASNIKFLDSDEISDTDTHEIVRWISTFLDENINSIKKEITKQMAADPGGGAGGKPGGLPPGGTSEPGSPPDPGGEKPDMDAVENELFVWVKERYEDLSDGQINEIVKHALSIRDYHIFVTSDLGDTQLYSYKVFGDKVLIEINSTHSFYRRFIQQFEEGDEKSLRSVRLLIGAMVNSELVNKTSDKSLLKDRRNVRNRMAESLDDYIEDLYSN